MTPDINKLLKDVLGADPLTEYSTPKKLDSAMLQGLAEMYANKGFREYLENAIKIAYTNAALSADNEMQGAFLKGRLITLKELLKKSKVAYEEFEKLKKLKHGNKINSN